MTGVIEWFKHKVKRGSGNESMNVKKFLEEHPDVDEAEAVKVLERAFSTGEEDSGEKESKSKSKSKSKKKESPKKEQPRDETGKFTSDEKPNESESESGGKPKPTDDEIDGLIDEMVKERLKERLKVARKEPPKYETRDKGELDLETGRHGIAVPLKESAEE